MMHAGLDLSRRKIDVCLLSDEGELCGELAVPADADGLRALNRTVVGLGEPVRGVIESMTGARFVHDSLEQLGWDVLIADAAKVKGLAPLACKTDKIDARVLAVLPAGSVPAIWLPDPRVRREREQARFRLHLSSTSRCSSRARDVDDVRAAVHGHGPVRGCRLAGLDLPQPWRGTVDASVLLIDDLERQIAQINAQLRTSGPEHPYVPLLMSAPGIGWVLAFTIAAEIGEIDRFSSPSKLVGYTGLCPRVYQSGEKDRRGPLTKQGPKYLRWAMLEATMHALRHPAYAERYQHTKRRLGRQRGAKVAQVEIARKLTEALWHMLTHNQPFNPTAAGGAAFRLAA